MEKADSPHLRLQEALKGKKKKPKRPPLTVVVKEEEVIQDLIHDYHDHISSPRLQITLSPISLQASHHFICNQSSAWDLSISYKGVLTLPPPNIPQL